MHASPKHRKTFYSRPTPTHPPTWQAGVGHVQPLQFRQVRVALQGVGVQQQAAHFAEPRPLAALEQTRAQSFAGQQTAAAAAPTPRRRRLP